MGTPHIFVKNVNLLTSLAETIKEKNSTLARLYRVKTLEMTQDMQGSLQQNAYVCSFCGECCLNCRNGITIRYQPKLGLSRIHFNTGNARDQHSKWKQHWLSLYRGSTTRMVLKCYVCGKKKVLKGPDRKQCPKTPTSSAGQSSDISTTSRTRKQRRKVKSKQKRKHKELNEAQSFEKSTASISMETESELDSSFGPPVISSTPKTHLPASNLLESQSAEKSMEVSRQREPPTLALWKYSHEKSPRDKKNAKQGLCTSLLLNDSLSQTPEKYRKRKKTKDLHLQLQKIFKQDKANNESTGSLRDFLSSI